MNDIAKGTEWGKVEVTIEPQFFPDLKIMIDNRGFLNQESRELLKEALRKGKDVRITAFTFHLSNIHQHMNLPELATVIEIGEVK